eukprot:TRINITY_DN3091_c0_g3_i1.p1 TRINITY_DN3091_c0_g3~~TRINITY_DN3091_c0_g3_i1.p1  ORF type:complete len:274 (-),score=74.52 TRINITY_DN3091_c0_g3_i1:485-1306(-)
MKLDALGETAAHTIHVLNRLNTMKVWNSDAIKTISKNVPDMDWMFSPEALKGTYVRKKRIFDKVNEFIQKYDGKCRIISFGAGFDTLFFDLIKEPLSFIEIERESFVQFKEDVLFKSGFDYEQLAAVGYSLVSNFNDIPALNCPTLVIFEVVLCYLDIEEVFSTLISLKAKIEGNGNFSAIIFDPIPGDDIFGKTMIKNFELSDTPLKLSTTHNSIEAYVDLFKNEGFIVQYDCMTDLLNSYNHENLIWIIEPEILTAMTDHYFFIELNLSSP